MSFNLDLFADQPSRPPPRPPPRPAAPRPRPPTATDREPEAPDLATTAATVDDAPHRPLPMPMPWASVAEAIAADTPTPTATPTASPPETPVPMAAPPEAASAPRPAPRPTSDTPPRRGLAPHPPGHAAPHDPALASAILALTERLAHTQALAQDVRDDQGFNNADFRLGFLLAATQDVEGCAQLLLLYPRQAKAAGLDLDALRAYVPPAPVDPEAPDAPALPMATHTRQHLKQRRERLGGTIGWVQDGDHIVCVGLASRMDFVTQQTLQRLGTRTPNGWRVPVTHLQLLLTGIDPAHLNNADGLRGALEAATEAGVAQAAEPPGRARPQALTAHTEEPVLSAKASSDGQTVHLNWTGWKTPTGAAVKERLKAYGAKFNGETSTWTLPTARMGGALQLMQDLPTVDASALTPFDGPPSPDDAQAVDDVRHGITRVRVRPSDTPGSIRLSVLAYHQRFVDATRAAGGRHRREHDATDITLSNLRPFFTALEDDPTLEFSAVVEAYLANLEARQQALQAQKATATGIPTITPTGKSLLPHQPEGIAHLVAPSVDPGCKGKLLGHAPGLGKTLQILMAANLVAPQERGKKIVIICPAIARDTWAKEIGKWLGPDERMNIVKGKKHAWNADARFHIVPMSVVAEYTEQIKAMDVGVAALDESHYLKDESAQRTKAVLGESPRKGKPRVVGCIEHADHIWAATGTPMPNRSIELFPLLRATGHPVGQNFFQYGMRYAGGHHTGFGYDFKGNSNGAELGQRLQGFLHVKKKDQVVGLPEKMRQIIDVDLSPAQQKAFDKDVKAMLRTWKRGDTANALVQLNALKLATARAKVAATVESALNLIAAGEKVGIFRQYTQMLDAIQAGIRDGVEDQPHLAMVRIDGATATNDRAALVEQFQTDPNAMVFLGTNAAGMNVTLTAASNALINDLPWNKATLTQQEDRFHRYGATRMVNIGILKANGTYDDDLLDLLDAKDEAWTDIEDAAQGIERSPAPTRAGATDDTRMMQRLMERLAAKHGINLSTGRAPTTRMEAALDTVTSSGPLEGPRTAAPSLPPRAPAPRHGTTLP